MNNLNIDFSIDKEFKFTTSGDIKNFYLLVYEGEDKYALYYNTSFVWVRHFIDTPSAVGSVVASLVDAGMDRVGF